MPKRERDSRKNVPEKFCFTYKYIKEDTMRSSADCVVVDCRCGAVVLVKAAFGLWK